MQQRITHIDTIRGLAIMGILVMNTVSFGLGSLAYFDISATGTVTLVDGILAVCGEIFADQKFMGLFSLLFGASFLLFIERVQRRSKYPACLTLWRNSLLFIFGILHLQLWEGDILSVYALCSPLLIVCRHCSAITLLSLGGVIFCLSPISSIIMALNIEGEVIKKALEAGTFERGLESYVGLTLLIDIFARALGMMFIGMGLFKQGWLTMDVGSKSLRFNLIIIFITSILNGLGVYWTYHQDFDGQAMIWGTLANTLTLIPMVLAYCRLFMWWDQSSQSLLVSKVRALGRMALSNYISQTLICLSIFYMLPTLMISRTTIWVVVILIWVLQLTWSEAWLKSYRLGPLEWLWRSATYRRLEPLKHRT